MPDYKEMYLRLFRACERAADILISAQQECEELYISQPEAELRVLASVKNAKSMDSK